MMISTVEISNIVTDLERANELATFDSSSKAENLTARLMSFTVFQVATFDLLGLIRKYMHATSLTE